MKNYAKPLPIDREGTKMLSSPSDALALATLARDNASASSVTSFNDNTTVVEVTAVGTGAAIKWAANQATSVVTAAGTANFDNYVAVDTTRLLVIPRQSIGTSSIVGLNIQAGLYNAVATKSSGVGSVLLNQY